MQKSPRIFLKVLIPSIVVSGLACNPTYASKDSEMIGLLTALKVFSEPDQIPANDSCGFSSDNEYILYYHIAGDVVPEGAFGLKYGPWTFEKCQPGYILKTDTVQDSLGNTQNFESAIKYFYTKAKISRIENELQVVRVAAGETVDNSQEVESDVDRGCPGGDSQDRNSLIKSIVNITSSAGGTTTVNIARECDGNSYDDGTVAKSVLVENKTGTTITYYGAKSTETFVQNINPSESTYDFSYELDTNPESVITIEKTKTGYTVKRVVYMSFSLETKSSDETTLTTLTETGASTEIHSTGTWSLELENGQIKRNTYKIKYETIEVPVDSDVTVTGSYSTHLGTVSEGNIVSNVDLNQIAYDEAIASFTEFFDYDMDTGRLYNIRKHTTSYSDGVNMQIPIHQIAMTEVERDSIGRFLTASIEIEYDDWSIATWNSFPVYRGIFTEEELAGVGV